MSTFKVSLIYILLISIAVSLAGCAADPASAPDVTFDIAVTSDMPIPDPAPVPTGYTGTMTDYEYRYESGESREWEEDILYLAQRCLDHHPKLTEKCWLYGDADGYTLEYYNPELREEFIREINDLILAVPELEEDELIFELSRITNILGDGHTRLYVTGSGFYFPLSFEVFYENGDAELYAVAVPDDKPELLFSKLTAINGIPVNEVIDRLLPYTYGDNDYWKVYIITETGEFITKKDMLDLVGVTDKDSDSADFTLETEDGSVTVTLTSEVGQSMTNKSFKALGVLTKKNSSLNYWHEFIEEDNMEYIRYNRCRERSDFSYSDFWLEIMLDIRACDTPPKVVFDLRGNGGGIFPPTGVGGFIASLKMVDVTELYVLIDHGVFSSASAVTAELKQEIDFAVTVGMPAGQSANLFGPANPFKLPNHSYYDFDMSDRQYVWWKGYEEYTILPDITVCQTVDDYKQGIDTVLEAVKGY